MRQSQQVADRSGIYQGRMQRFLGRIRQYQNEEVKKINEKSNDEIQFESNKIISESRAWDQDNFGKRQKGLEVDSKIRRSRKINECRLSKMKMRFQMIEKIQNQIKAKLLQTCSNVQSYSQLVKSLMLQGMIKMLQQKIQVRCLARDVDLINRLIPECETQFGQMCEVKTKITLNHQRLPDSQVGGIVLTSLNGKIVCNNTLRARLDYALQQSLPEVRNNLFPSGNAPQHQQQNNLI